MPNYDNVLAFIENPVGDDVGVFAPYGQRIGAMLRTLPAPSPALEGALTSWYYSGSETLRNIRRAMVMLNARFRNAEPAAAVRAVSFLSGRELSIGLRSVMMEIISRRASNQLPNDAADLLANPEAFVTNNRLYLQGTGRRPSDSHDYAFIYNIEYHRYDLKPAIYAFGAENQPIRAFDIAVQQFSDISDTMGAIVGDAVTEDLCITTQLTGCAILYRVEGASLTCTHIQPSARFAWPRNEPAYSAFAQAGEGAIMGKMLERYGDLAGGGAGVLGLYRSAIGPGNVHYRDARRADDGPGSVMQVHGYHRATGTSRAYFIAVRRAGAWQIFGHENIDNNPDAGITRVTRLFPR